MSAENHKRRNAVKAETVVFSRKSSKMYHLRVKGTSLGQMKFIVFGVVFKSDMYQEVGLGV